MKAIKSTLEGKTAMFKKPDVNAFAYFTYSHIHKIALLGIFGAVIGLGGYNQQNFLDKTAYEKRDYPEFYAKLQNLKISIQPDLKNNGYFSKKIQTFNNSVGYASREEGGNLIVREQWLENPMWTIYILDNSPVEAGLFESLKDNLLNNQCVYAPYLGKNDHPAVIHHCEHVELYESKDHYITSLFPSNGMRLDGFSYNDKAPYIFRERMPFRLNKEYNFYEYEEFVMTNSEIENREEMEKIYADGEYRLIFF